MEHNENRTKRKSHSSECLHKEMEGSYSISLATHLNLLDQNETNIPKRTRQQEIIKLRDETTHVETQRTIQRINKTRIWFFEKISKIEKHLARLIAGHRYRIQINKIWNEKGDITTETEKIKKNQILLQNPIINKTGKSGLND